MAGPPFNIDDASPNPNDVISAFPANEQANRALIEEWLSFISDPATGLLKPAAFPSGFGASVVLYEDDTFTFSTAAPLFVTGLDLTEYRMLVVEMFVTNLSANGGIVALNMIPGDASGWSSEAPVIARWDSSTTNARSIKADITNLNDADFAIVYQSVTNGTDWETHVMPSTYSGRPVTRFEFRLTPVPSTSVTAFIGKLRITGVR